ncbi:MAG TPA: hypothetical protein VFG31_03980, partial [Conexibacter sp.]|nr:hypothetical protein [Conexibacter sp.]
MPIRDRPGRACLLKMGHGRAVRAERPQGVRTQRIRAAVALLASALAAAAGVVGVLATFRQDHRVDVATVRMSVHPGDAGALALYVPLVDWGVRFPVVRLPAELRLDVRSVDRPTVQRIARGQQVDLDALRAQVRDAVARYLRALLAVALARRRARARC